MLKKAPWMMVGGLVLASACATEDAGDGAIAEVALANGSVVSFFEPSPGAILIEQSAQTRDDLALDLPGSAIEIYRALAPNAPVPEALASAQARQDELRAAQPPRAKSPPAAAPGPSAINCSVSGWSVVHCVIDRHIGFGSTYNTTEAALFETCVDAGGVRFKLEVNDALTLDHAITSSQSCFQAQWTSALFDQKVHGQVYNVASTDQYDHAAKYR